MFATPAMMMPTIRVYLVPKRGINRLTIGEKTIKTKAYAEKTRPFTDSRIPFLDDSVGKNGAMMDMASIELKLIIAKQMRTKC